MWLTAVPTPVRITRWGLPAALSVTNIEDLRGPDAVGLNTGFITQEADASKVLGQLCVRLKSPLLPSEIEIPEIVSGPKPVLVIVSVWAALAVCTNWFTKLRPAGDAVTAGRPAKFAVTVRAALLVTDCGFVVPLTSPLQLANRYPVADLAVSWTLDPEL